MRSSCKSRLSSGVRFLISGLIMALERFCLMREFWSLSQVFTPFRATGPPTKQSKKAEKMKLLTSWAWRTMMVPRLLRLAVDSQLGNRSKTVQYSEGVICSLRVTMKIFHSVAATLPMTGVICRFNKILGYYCHQRSMGFWA
jgi:hypothetical protein